MRKVNLILFILFVFCINSLKAQYTEVWNSSNGIGSSSQLYIGCVNLDSDSQKELVFAESNSIGYLYQIDILDGLTGNLKGSIPFIRIYSPVSLVDVNNNGKYEILFAGQKNNGDPFKWYLYALGGGGKVEEISNNNTQFLNYPNPFKNTTNVKLII